MTPFSAEGQFWLPDVADRKVPGSLALTNTLKLNLDGAMLAYKPPAPGESRRGGGRTRHALVHGVLRDGREVTLMDVQGIDASGPFGRVTEGHAVKAVLLSGLVDQDLFVEASCRFDGLSAWADPDPMSEEHGGPDDQVVVSTARQVLAEACHAEMEVRLVVGVEGTSGGDRVHLDQVSMVEVQGPPSPLAVIVDEWMRPVQDFLVVALGGPARLTSLRVRDFGAGPRDGRLEVLFAATQPPESPVPTVAGVRSYYSPALHRREDLEPPIDELLAAWLEIYGRLGDSVSLITAPFHAPFMYGEHRYATAFQAAEALMRRLHSGPEKTRQEHRERVRTVVEALSQSGLPQDTVGWATRVLQARNDKSLPQMIDELLSNVGEVGADIRTADPAFARAAAGLRTGVAHGGTDRADSVRRHWYGQALLWAVRVRLLNEAGVPLSLQTDRARGTPAFKQMLAGLAEQHGPG